MCSSSLLMYHPEEEPKTTDRQTDIIERERSYTVDRRTCR